MPRLYLTPQEIGEQPLGIALQGQLSQLAPGVLDKLLARCSVRADNSVEKRLQSPGTSTLSVVANAGDMGISVISTLTLDNLAENAVILDPNTSLQEIVQIVPGGVNVSSWQFPYPGTLTLETSLQFAHSNGAPVQYAYKETSETISASKSDPYSEALMDQTAQLALAHLPPVHTGLNRLTFLKSYPILKVYRVEHAYSYATDYNLIYSSALPTFSGAIIIEPTSGFYRFKVGSVVLPEGFTRTTYVGGYSNVPEDIKSAVTYYLADELAIFSNPNGAVDMMMGKRRQSFTMQQGKTPNASRAEDLLQKYRRMI